jgi:hypothetical protein
MNLKNPLGILNKFYGAYMGYVWDMYGLSMEFV